MLRIKKVKNEPNKEPVNKSSFIITINSNQVGENEEFEEAIDRFYEQFYNFLIVLDEAKVPLPINPRRIVIGSPSIEIEYEEGPKFGRNHTHTVFSTRIKNGYKFTLDVVAMNQWFLDKLGMRVYINVKYISGGINAAKNYIRKKYLL